ncbi:MAG TPA: penicillin acylase family protein [Candidatus Acidoferrales bacterium]|nr:penicillin acylase family protein [Candidatus Acidoferrales bacterium]
MRTSLRFLRFAFAAAFLLAVVAILTGWWTIRRTLPQLDGSAVLPGLRAEVQVQRDALGVPHIRAQSLEDLLTAQGYVVAQDRLWQMDLLRRVAAGELSEIFGEVAYDHDVESRTLGFAQAADAAVAAMPPDRRAMLDAYARGVNLYIEQRGGRLPVEFLLLRYKPRPWAARDTLLIAANLYKELTGFWNEQMLRAEVSQVVGPELANDLYAATADSRWDHPLVGLAPEPVKGTPARPAKPARRPAKLLEDTPLEHAAQLPSAPSSQWSPADGPLPVLDDGFRGAGGSNNWVVNGSRTSSGHPLLANDTHLTFTAPCIWYLLHLTAPGWNVKGFTFPGGPLVVIGHNERIAWGFTNNFADVLDVYTESFNPLDPLAYRVNGEWQRATVRHEVIRVRGEADRNLDVILTRHGPVVRRDGNTGYAIRWTATDPGGLDASYFLLGGAENWDEFRAILREAPGPAQNAVYADVDGNIGYIMSARVPTRRLPTGGIPVPGDTDDHEWTGYIPRDALPQLYNPPEGLIATANARVVGPDYKWYLTDNWMVPYRTTRIYELLDGRKNLRPEDFIQIETDIYSYPQVQIAQELAKARRKVRAADPRTSQFLRIVTKWDGRAAMDSVMMSFLEFTRRALLYNLLRPRLGANVDKYAWMRAGVFLEKVLRERPARWLPPGFHNYDELLISSADLAVNSMSRESHTNDVPRWEWGAFNQLRMFHPLGREGLLRRVLSIGPMPISGSIFSVKQIARTFGPSMRFVADLSNFDGSLMNITMGQSGQYLSPNYRDQFDAWYEGRGIPSRFSPGAEHSQVVHTLRLLPAPPP